MRQILFVGDSITDCSRNREDIHDLGPGYPSYTAKFLKEAGYTQTEFINKGISGDRAKSLVARYDVDFKPFNPDYITVMIGINDTWRRYDSNDPTSCEAFYASYRELMLRFKHDFPAAKIIVIEPYLLESDPSKLWREDFDPRLGMVRKIAREFADAFLPLDGYLVSLVVSGIDDKALSADGVHPTPTGHEYIGRALCGEILKLEGKK